MRPVPPALAPCTGPSPRRPTASRPPRAVSATTQDSSPQPSPRDWQLYPRPLSSRPPTRVHFLENAGPPGTPFCPLLWGGFPDVTPPVPQNQAPAGGSCLFSHSCCLFPTREANALSSRPENADDPRPGAEEEPGESFGNCAGACPASFRRVALQDTATVGPGTPRNPACELRAANPAQPTVPGGRGGHLGCWGAQLPVSDPDPTLRLNCSTSNPAQTQNFTCQKKCLCELQPNDPPASWKRPWKRQGETSSRGDASSP